MSNKIEYRELTDFEEYSQLEEIQQDAWDVPDRELVRKKYPNLPGIVILHRLWHKLL